MPEEPYDPLDYENLAQSIIAALVARPVHPLPPSEPFHGAGVYAIYYTGEFPAYAAISADGCVRPIYIGSALPPGSRTGSIGQKPHRKLCARLAKHAERIAQVSDVLCLADFRCRYLVVAPEWVRFVEWTLVTREQPVWNVLVDGFGNNPHGKGRMGGNACKWDILHERRDYIAKYKLQEKWTADEIADEVRAHFAVYVRRDEGS